MISVKAFLSKVEEIACEDPAYRIGGTGTDGTCDCIGLIVGAIRRAGGTWSGRKGSNYAARHEVVSLASIARIADLTVGEAVFKARNPGDSGYDAETIQRNYADSADKRDYYHIGVVESVQPLRIRHMTTPRAKTDTSLGKWSYHGWLRKIKRLDTNEEGSEMNPVETVLIYGGALGSPVNMRSSASLQSPILTTIPQHTAVEMIEAGEKWTRVRYGSKTGYVQSVFVHSAEEVSLGNPAGESDPDSLIRIPRSKLEAVYDDLKADGLL